jgi:hypothetical protein
MVLHGAVSNESTNLSLQGQVGTVVMEFDGTAFEVEFSNRDGTTF